MTLTFVCDLEVLATRPRRNKPEKIELKGGFPYKVSDVQFSGNSVAFTLSKGQRVQKLATKYLKKTD